MNSQNLAYRFLLELAALGSMAYWGYQQSADTERFAWMIAVPVAAAVIWGVFAVPGDPGRGQDGFIRIPGLLRLVLEGLFFGFAAWALIDLGHRNIAYTLAFAALLHYVFSLKRIKWLLRQ